MILPSLTKGSVIYRSSLSYDLICSYLKFVMYVSSDSPVP